jgi:predicted RNase H-like HicB family nuclease
MAKKTPYSVIIQWSNEDRAYVATLPEWSGCHTHGATYEKAAKNAQEVLELLMETEKKDRKALPPAHTFISPGPTGFSYEISNHYSGKKKNVPA